MQTVNNNTPEQINSALFAIGDDITKQNAQTKNAIKSSESTLQKQIDKLTDSLKNNGGLIIGGTYDINISGNASTSTNATNATNAEKATKDSAGNVITTTYATKAEVPTKTSELTNDSDFITSSGSTTGNAATATKLQTARTINGTSFDGSANITTTKWGTARNIKIASSDGTNASAAVSVNGSAEVTLKLPGTITATLIGTATTANKIRTSAPSSPQPGDIWIA